MSTPSSSSLVPPVPGTRMNRAMATGSTRSRSDRLYLRPASELAGLDEGAVFADEPPVFAFGVERPADVGIVVDVVGRARAHDQIGARRARAIHDGVRVRDAGRPARGIARCERVR